MLHAIIKGIVFIHPLLITIPINNLATLSTFSTYLGIIGSQMFT